MQYGNSYICKITIAFDLSSLIGVVAIWGQLFQESGFEYGQG